MDFREMIEGFRGKLFVLSLEFNWKECDRIGGQASSGPLSRQDQVL
jgi:hypothetical protein